MKVAALPQKQSWIGAESAVLAWVVLLTAITCYVVAYDLWAYHTGHRMMTTQFRIWLTQAWMGPIIVGLWFGIFLALCFHFFYQLITRSQP